MYRIMYAKDRPGMRYVSSTQLVEWGELPHPYRRSELTKTHAEIAAVDMEPTEGVLNEIFQAMQGEVWSPDGNARSIVQDAGVGHTSMSVGDVIYDDATRKAWEVVECGFREMQ